MTTIVINENTEEGRSLMHVVRAMKKSYDMAVHIYEDAEEAYLDSLPFEPIPGFEYTDEERIASVRKSVESIRAGRTVSLEEVRAKHPRI